MEGDESGSKPHDQQQAHRNLVSGVIAEAIRDICETVEPKNDQQRRLRARNRELAAAWIRSRSRHAFGFEWCSITLDLDPNRVRNEISRRKLHELVEPLFRISRIHDRWQKRAATVLAPSSQVGA